MARKIFAGDFVRSLPKGRVEPYRLWFEYLKLAHTLIPDRINRSFYAPWGDVENSDFDDWWSSHWRELFTVPASVSKISSDEEYTIAANDEKSILIRIQRHGTTTQKLADIKKILDGAFGKGANKSDIEPAFSITAKRNVHYPALRHKLRFMQIYQQHKTVEEAAKRYMAWAEAWNAKLKPRSPSRTAIPRTISRFAKELEAYESERAARPRAKKSREYNNARSDIVRFLKSGDKILSNVASGVFPGSE